VIAALMMSVSQQWNVYDGKMMMMSTMMKMQFPAFDRCSSSKTWKILTPTDETTTTLWRRERQLPTKEEGCVAELKEMP
jgi:hypothetical protein